MGRLIDIDNVIAVIDEEIRVLAIQKEQEYKSKIDKLKYLKNVIEYLPTTYDVEKVVAQIQEEKFGKSDETRIALSNAQEYVRKGGVE